MVAPAAIRRLAAWERELPFALWARCTRCGTLLTGTSGRHEVGGFDGGGVCYCLGCADRLSAR